MPSIGLNDTRRRRRILMVDYQLIESILSGNKTMSLPPDFKNAVLMHVIPYNDCNALGFVYESSDFPGVAIGAEYPKAAIWLP